MAPYLPRNGVSGSPYSEGGALYALGLIHANHGQAIRWDWRARRGAMRRALPCAQLGWHCIRLLCVSVVIFPSFTARKIRLQE